MTRRDLESLQRLATLTEMGSRQEVLAEIPLTVDFERHVVCGLDAALLDQRVGHPPRMSRFSLDRHGPRRYVIAVKPGLREGEIWEGLSMHALHLVNDTGRRQRRRIAQHVSRCREDLAISSAPVRLVEQRDYQSLKQALMMGQMDTVRACVAASPAPATDGTALCQDPVE